MDDIDPLRDKVGPLFNVPTPHDARPRLSGWCSGASGDRFHDQCTSPRCECPSHDRSYR